MTVSKLFRKCHLQLALLSSRQSHQNSSKNIIASKVPSIQIPRIPLPNFIWNEGCANHSDKIAIVSFALKNCVNITKKCLTSSYQCCASHSFGKLNCRSGDALRTSEPLLPLHCSRGHKQTGSKTFPINFSF